MSAGQAAQLQKSMFGKTADQMRDEALAKRMSSKQNDSQSSQGGSSGSSGGGGGGGGPKNALYTFADHNSGSKYPSWKDGKPNLLTYLDALDSSSPIVGSQFELVWSRWPRTIFFAKNITVPGIEVNTLEINHAGFVIPIPTHVAYGTNEITMTILADKEGFHYYDMRNMVLQSAHPFVAGDTKSMIGSFENISDEDILDIRLRNSPEDVTHHHWIIHNFHPIRIGDVELSHDSSNFVEFELAGNFTHIKVSQFLFSRCQIHMVLSIDTLYQRRNQPYLILCRAKTREYSEPVPVYTINLTEGFQNRQTGIFNCSIS